LKAVLRAFGLALRGIFHPWVIWLSFRPFLIGAALWFGIFWIIWTPLLDWMKDFLTGGFALRWLPSFASLGWGESLRGIAAPYFSVVVVMPLIILSILVLVSFTTVTSVLRHLEKQAPYRQLQKKYGGSFLGSFWVTVSASLIFLVLVVISLPIWFVPPMFALVPPLLWGWLTTKLMTYDVLARHASKEERQAIMTQQRVPLLCMGIAAGLMGSMPTFFWLSSVFILVLFPFVSMLMMWVYSMVFIFAAMWFGHYLLSVLQKERELKGELLEA
jgi:Etoposide-induced protein 2.4 (EI24)